MRTSPLLMLLRRRRPPLALGVVVAVLCIAAETSLAYFLPRSCRCTPWMCSTCWASWWSGRLPQPIELTVYFVVSEALTNAAKHAHASVVRIGLTADGTAVRLSVRDDGVGGADPGSASGLLGLRDRVEALGGTIEVRSPVGEGTALLVEIPLGDRE